MRVHVNEAGGDDLALGIDFRAPLRPDLSDHHDLAIGDAQITDIRFATETVEDRAAADHQIKRDAHDRSLPSNVRGGWFLRPGFVGIG